MNRLFTISLIGLATLFLVHCALALSEQLHSPRIFFAKNYDPQKADVIAAVLKDPQFKFRDGLTSYWEPHFATTLAYDGDTKSLNTFLGNLSHIQGLHVLVTFSKDLAKETHSFPQAGSWWVEYRHTAPDTVTVRVNLASKEIDVEQLRLRPAEG
jgi:hypothetical protein